MSYATNNCLNNGNNYKNKENKSACRFDVGFKRDVEMLFLLYFTLPWLHKTIEPRANSQGRLRIFFF